MFPVFFVGNGKITCGCKGVECVRVCVYIYMILYIYIHNYIYIYMYMCLYCENRHINIARGLHINCTYIFAESYTQCTY
jgi:hypothetical protein